MAGNGNRGKAGPVAATSTTPLGPRGSPVGEHRVLSARMGSVFGQHAQAQLRATATPVGQGQRAMAAKARASASTALARAAPQPLATRIAERAHAQGRTHATRAAAPTQRARLTLARLNTQFGKARTNAKRAIQKGDTARAKAHTARAGQIANRMDRIAPIAAGMRRA